MYIGGYACFDVNCAGHIPMHIYTSNTYGTSWGYAPFSAIAYIYSTYAIINYISFV